MEDEPLRILEMGAGTGGTTMVLAPFLASLNIPVEYTSTDLSASMVALARRKHKKYPFMKFAIHDIKKPAADDLRNQYIVIASSAVHATHNLTASFTRWEKDLQSVGFGHVDWTDGSLPENGIQKVIIAFASGPIHVRLPKPEKQQTPENETTDVAEREGDSASLRNVIDLARDDSCTRATGFKVSFPFISSIGVVGHYRLWSGKVHVPEERVEMKSVLANGYCEAKFTYERILEATLHQYPEHFRPMSVRLGRIAGSRTSGYWNPVKHLSFLIKSSQSRKALPAFDGILSWVPVNDVAETLADLLFSRDGTISDLPHWTTRMGSRGLKCSKCWLKRSTYLSRTLFPSRNGCKECTARRCP
ncbi:uncharacterized protein PAC_00332 [Phialocephala subalpina]|uniref:Methyltransferase type 12 domain-containing protein n=1 Tax=Phialocephala subalpina TaxID=576137 RepID=A0A1L7WCQ1_9HELO|nr:uncharacterized protein PAC_00332 [Phialocephala subalpina]